MEARDFSRVSVHLLECCQMEKRYKSSRSEETVKKFNQKLPLPSTFKDNKKIHFISFFTEQGLVDFTNLLKIFLTCSLNIVKQQALVK